MGLTRHTRRQNKVVGAGGIQDAGAGCINDGIGAVTALCNGAGRVFAFAAVVVGACLGAAGCGSQRNRDLVVMQVCQGEYGQARATVASSLESDVRSRAYIYDRMRLAMIVLADGLPEVADVLINDVFEILRTQGINADRTVAAVLTWEGIKIWKGEPFEQAMMYAYVAVQKAMLGEWDNARAASLNSLFLLKDFGRAEAGARKTTEEIVTEAVRREKEQKRADYLDAGYSPVETTFALGYLLNAVANMAMAVDDPDRAAEAEDCLAKVEAINVRMKEEQEKQKAAYAARAQAIEAQLLPWYQAAGNNPHARAQLDQYRAYLLGVAPEDPSDLAPVLNRLRSRGFNTILVVDYGLGPTKERYGVDDVFARFRQARGWYGIEPLRIKVNGNSDEAVPVACNLNDMAADHMWNNMEDLRELKSRIGSALVVGGTAAMASGNEYAQYAGLAIALVGLAVKASAAADVRYCEIMPQRVYFAPVMIKEPDTTLELQVEGRDGSRVVLCGVGPPEPPQVFQLRYVRLPPLMATAQASFDRTAGIVRITRNSPGQGPAWATAGTVYYANDAYAKQVPGDELPYILGGRCVRKPTQDVLARYQQSGVLSDMTLDELKELYAAEGIALEGVPDPGAVHVLEGGNSLDCPLPGTIGFARLFCQKHESYKPKSERVRELRRRIGREAAPVAAAR